MNRLRSQLVPLYALLLALFLTGCQAQLHESGVILNPEATAKIHPGITTRAEVLERLGPPTLVNTFNSNRWLYVQDRKFQNMQRTFSRVANRIEITFDSNGVVQDIKKNFNDQVWDPTQVPEANSDKGWMSWLWDRSYIHPATNPSAPSSSGVSPKAAESSNQAEPTPSKPWWRFGSSDEKNVSNENRTENTKIQEAKP
ncbi:MAG: outer membrane protein assembly factor BamE [Magnetococcus sp. YQC-5]